MLIQDRLKSFVLRKGRITSNQKRAINELWERFVIDGSRDLESSWAEKPSALDIGFGAGETTIHLAKTKPEMSVLGAEVYLSGIGSLLSKADEESLNNISILNEDVAPFLEERVPDDCFNLILMFYPDPWPKRKHHKRRLIQLPFIEDLAKCVCSNGFCHLVTDWDQYADWIDSVFSISDSWQKGIANPHQSEWLEKRSITRFEERGIKLGNKISEFLFTCVRSN